MNLMILMCFFPFEFLPRTYQSLVIESSELKNRLRFFFRCISAAAKVTGFHYFVVETIINVVFYEPEKR